MDATFTLSTFTPGEAERITAVTTAQQRDWRRREILPTGKGHSRFDAFALTEMWVMKLLSDRGIGPQATKDVAFWCASGIVWHALRWREASDVDEGKIPVPSGEWRLKASWLINGVWRSSNRPRVMPGRHLIWWADGSHTFTPSLDQALDGVSSADPRVCGPLVILDLEALGSTLVGHVHPLVRVSFGETGA